VISKDEYESCLAQVGAAYREIVGKHYPAMALVQVADLLEVGAKLEIQGLAVLSGGD
jgi:enamine deaminase RidA (YjgF/YER057c/UK114 family)